MMIFDTNNKFSLEAGRLDSFDNNWPHPNDSICSKENMAKAGFFYTGRSDCVKCFVCRLKLEGWDLTEDNPWHKHIECSPNCTFAKFGKEEGLLTVEQWLDVFCSQAINTLDSKLNQILKESAVKQ